jgi:hypothetical protein
MHPIFIANKIRNCYFLLVAVRACRVTCRDAQGVEHTVQVTAQSLFEAVAQALRVFREHDWSNEPNSGSASVVVTIKPAEVEHRVRTKDFQTRLESAPKSPAEMALNGRLREILGR